MAKQDNWLSRKDDIQKSYSGFFQRQTEDVSLIMFKTNGTIYFQYMAIMAKSVQIGILYIQPNDYVHIRSADKTTGCDKIKGNKC